MTIAFLLAMVVQVGEAGPRGPRVVSLQAISAGGSPLGSCRLDDWKIEVSLAVHPRDPRRLVAGWIQGVTDAQGRDTQTNAWATSKDGGRRWSAPKPVPGLTDCSGSGEAVAVKLPNLPEWAADPNVSIGPDGIAYLASVRVQPLAPPTCCGHILVNRSSDSGARWERPTSIDEPQSFGRNDPAWVTADPRIPGRAYLAWNHLWAPPSVKFASTSDGGRTWSLPTLAAVDTPGRLFDLAPVVVLSDGTLLLFYADSPLVAEGPASEWVLRSTDGGASWAAPVRVGDHGYPNHTRRRSVAAGRDGTAYVAWTDTRTGQVTLARSDDGGRSWTRRQVARHPGAQHPTVAVRADGVVGLIWYDRRRDGVDNDVWFAHSTDRGASWRHLHLAGPFAANGSLGTTAGLDNGPLGGYQGFVATREGFAAAFVMTEPQARTGPSDVFFARIAL